MNAIPISLTSEDRVSASVNQFKKITRYYALFNLFFALAAFLEVFCFLLFFSFFAKSAFLGLSIGILFFTGFSYFVLLFYFQGKKPEQLLGLKESYLEACQASIQHPPNTASYHLSLVDGLYQLAEALQNQEYRYYRIPSSLDTLGPLLKKFSVWAYWKEVHQMREMLLLSAIQEHVQLIRKQPTDLQAHIALAQCYQMLAGLCRSPKEEYELSVYASYEMKQKFKSYMERALEEFKIVAHFSPNNAWGHWQLATIYHALDLSKQEIQECEVLRTLLPADKEVLLRLGTLYFQQGHSALGLLIYEELGGIDASYAELLMTEYILPPLQSYPKRLN
jgi:hypothetical protein